MQPLNRRQFQQLALTVGMAGWCRATWGASERRDVSWLQEVQRAPAALPADAPVLSELLVDQDGQPIANREAWLKRRDELRKEWQKFLGSLGHPEDHRPELEIVKEDREAGVVRQLVRYEVEPDVFTEAYLLKPLDNSAARPGVVVFHSTVNHSILQPAGLGPDPQKAFGLKLAKRGMVAFCPRNFLWPDNGRIAADEETKRFQKRHPGVTGMAKMLYDARVAVNILAGQPNVDPNRLGSVGHSLGAKEVLYLAAFDDRIQATVSSEGGIGTKFSNWDAPWYLGPSIKAPEFRREHHELLAMIAPRAFLLIGGESADNDRGWPFIQAALRVYRLFEPSPRIGFYNHRQGHAVPPESEQRIQEWLEAYL